MDRVALFIMTKNLGKTLGNWLQVTVVGLGIWRPWAAVPEPQPGSCMASGRLMSHRTMRQEDTDATLQSSSSGENGKAGGQAQAEWLLNP